MDHTCSKLVSVESQLITGQTQSKVRWLLVPVIFCSLKQYKYLYNTKYLLSFLYPFPDFVFSLWLSRFLIHRGSLFDLAVLLLWLLLLHEAYTALSLTEQQELRPFLSMHPLLHETRKITDSPSLHSLLEIRHILSVVPTTTKLFMNSKWPWCCRIHGEVSCAVCIWTT